MTDLFNTKDLLTVATADQAEINTRGYFGDNLSDLIEKVRLGKVETLTDVMPDEAYCFERNNNDDSYYIFFLPEDKVKEKVKEPVYRPFKDLYEFYKFLSISPFTKKEFCNEYLLKFSFTYREKILPQIVSSVVITRLDVGSDNDPCSTFINRKDLKDWFDNFEIYKFGEWHPFGVEVKEND